MSSRAVSMLVVPALLTSGCVALDGVDGNYRGRLTLAMEGSQQTTDRLMCTYAGDMVQLSTQNDPHFSGRVTIHLRRDGESVTAVIVEKGNESRNGVLSEQRVTRDGRRFRVWGRVGVVGKKDAVDYEVTADCGRIPF